MDEHKYIGGRRRVEGSILSTLAYSGVFDYPLTFQEICERSPYPSCIEQVMKSAVDNLVGCGLVNENGGFYFLGNDGSVVSRRLEANARAAARMRPARFFSSLIARFPYVRAVMISGSMSKGVMDPDDDIDFFIVTEPDRLWITRVLLTLFKRVFLLNSHRNFCLNYFISSDKLLIPERNIFTASEIGSLLPMFNRDVYLDFMKVNDWYKDFYPNVPLRESAGTDIRRYAGSMLEHIVSGRFAGYLDDFCLSITRNFLSRKYHTLQPERFETDLETTKSVSKHHPNQQQLKILGRYREILAELQEKMNNVWPESGNTDVYERIA